MNELNVYNEVLVNPSNLGILNKQKNKISSIIKKTSDLNESFEENKKYYLKFLELVETNNISKIDSSEFMNEYNNLVIIFYKLLEIKQDFKELSKIKFNILSTKEKNSKIIIKNLNELYSNIEEDITHFDNKFNYLFNRFNLVLAKKIDNNELDFDELFSNIKQLEEKTVEILIEENKSGNNKLTPYSFIIENNERLFKLTNYLENEQNLENEYNEYLEVDKKFNNSNLELNFYNNLSEKHKELLSITLKKNFKLLFSKILGNPELSDEEKIDKIEEIFRENIENNYLFVFREKAGEIFEEIFKNNYLGKDIFERLIGREKNNGINKNIRLKFIQNYNNLDEILDYINNPFSKKEKDSINIKLGTRSTIAILKRLEKEKNTTKDIKQKRKYNDYYVFFKKILIEKYSRNESKIREGNSYNKEKYSNNNKLIKDYLQVDDILKLQETISNDFTEIIENYTTINLEEKINNNSIDEIKSPDLIKMLEKGTYAYILYEMFQNGKIKKGKKQWKKQIALAILENQRTFTIDFLLKNNFFSEQDKQNIIFEFIEKSDNLLKKLEVLKNIGNNFNKKEILKILISGNVSYQDFINILGNTYFKNVNLKLYNNGIINKEDTEIFLNIFFKSSNEELAIQSIGMMKDFTTELIKEGIYISPNKKEFELIKNGEVLFKLKSLY